MGGVLCKKHNKTEPLPYTDIIDNQINTPVPVIEENSHKDHKEDVSINNEELYKNHHEEHLTDEEKAINEIVERYLNNHLVNCKFIPDFIERKMYRNVLKMIMGILEDTIEKTEIHVLGHKINFTITPIVNDNDKEPVLNTNTKNVLTINPNIITSKLNDNHENEIVSHSITTSI